MAGWPGDGGTRGGARRRGRDAEGGPAVRAAAGLCRGEIHPCAGRRRALAAPAAAHPAQRRLAVRPRHWLPRALPVLLPRRLAWPPIVRAFANLPEILAELPPL